MFCFVINFCLYTSEVKGAGIMNTVCPFFLFDAFQIKWVCILIFVKKSIPVIKQ